MQRARACVLTKKFGLHSATSGVERSHTESAAPRQYVSSVLIPSEGPATRHVALRNVHRINLPRVSDRKIARRPPQYSAQQQDAGSAAVAPPRFNPSRHQDGRPSCSIPVPPFVSQQERL